MTPDAPTGYPVLSGETLVVPILGDPIYGTAPRFGGPGLHLHARAVTVPLYPKKPAIAVEAPVPEHMRERVAACGGASPSLPNERISLP